MNLCSLQKQIPGSEAGQGGSRGWVGKRPQMRARGVGVGEKGDKHEWEQGVLGVGGVEKGR